jgi:hypothetical protein
MNELELNQIKVLSEFVVGRRSEVSAAGVLDLRIRQTRRLLKAFRSGGGSALIHKARSRVSDNSLIPSVREYATELVRSRYADFGPTLAAWRLLAKDAVPLPRETLLKWFIEEEIYVKNRMGATTRPPLERYLRARGASR